MKKECPECCGEGTLNEFVSSCCGSKPYCNGDSDTSDIGICPDCGDHCEYGDLECDNCGGTGEVFKCDCCGGQTLKEGYACETCCVRGTNTGHNFKLD